MRCMRSVSILCIAIVSGLPLLGLAAEDQFAEPPQEVFQSEVVYPQGQGELQLNTAPTFQKNSEEKRYTLPLVVEYGITDNLQIGLEWESLVHLDTDGEDATSGIGDLEIGAKYSWLNINGSNLHGASGVEIGIPTGDEDRGLGEEDESVTPFAILAYDVIPDYSQVFLHAGTEISDGEEVWFANTVFFTTMNNYVLTAEWNWSEEERYFTPGLLWHPTDDWELGIGAPVGISNESDDYRIIMMLTYETKLL